MNPSTYGLLMLTKREIARYTNVWAQTLIPPVVMAALFLFVFGEALGDRIGTFGGVPYLAFIAPGLVAQGAIQNAYNNTGSSFFDSRRAHYIEDVLTSPLGNAQIITAHLLAGTSRGLAIAFLTLLIALPFTTGWGAFDPVVFILVLVLACAGFSLLGLVVGLHATRWDHIFIPMTFILTPLTFLGGVFYPVTALPERLELLSRLNPILYIVDALRGATLGVHDLPMWPSVAGLLVADVLLFAFVLRLFGRSARLRG